MTNCNPIWIKYHRVFPCLLLNRKELRQENEAAERLEGAEKKTRAVVRRIETGLSTSDHTEILSGLSEGDRVVLFGQTMIEGGDLVKVIGAGEED